MQFAPGIMVPEIVTMPPSVFEKMYNHVLTDKGLDIFDKDWEAVQNARSLKKKKFLLQMMQQASTNFP